MGIREWQVKASELKALTRGGLVLLSARCAMRTEPWLPEDAASLWADNLAFVVAGAFAASNAGATVETVERERSLSNRGAMACNRLAAIDVPLGRCMNYAMLTLASAVGATALVERPAVLKAVTDAAKLSASIAAVWAHAGRVRVAGDAVDVVCTTTWSAIRTDIAPLAAAMNPLEASNDRIRALREIGPLWPGGAPAWASPR